MTQEEKQKAIDRYYQLYEEASARFLDKIDFDATELLTEEEKKEYRLGCMLEHDYCPFCGENEEACECN